MKNSGEKSEEKEKIKKILKITSEDKNKKKQSTSIEKKILREIRK